jgi:hypothetical protein
MKKTDYKKAILGKSLSIIISINLIFALTIFLSCDDGSRSDKTFRSRPEKLADGWEGRRNWPMAGRFRLRNSRE